MTARVITAASGVALLVATTTAGQGRCQVGPTVAKTERTSEHEWPSYAADNRSSKFSAADQITRENFESLQVAWRWCSPDSDVVAANPGLWPHHYEATPIAVDGVLYTSTSLSQAAALDPVTGDTLWVFDPESYRSGSPPNLGFVHRGVAYWEDGDDRRIFYGAGNAVLHALDADTGAPVGSFAGGAPIDLTHGLRRPANRRLYGVSSPPVICNDVVVVGASILDFPAEEPMPPGDVRGFDARTGELRWTFHSVPLDGEPGADTWLDGSLASGGGANVWAPMSCDDERGYVYLPVGTASNDYYGARRPGSNRYSESLVALEAASGRLVWSFQTVHHGIWDYDLPAAPNLVDIEVDGRAVEAVAQVTKQGFTFVFNRETGEPVWPIEERAVAPSSVLGEAAAATQPFPTTPPPFDQQGITRDDLIDFTPALRAEAEALLERFTSGPLFTPPTERGTAAAPGIAGGASWAGAAAGPDGTLYVPSVTLPFVLPLARQSGGPHIWIGQPFPMPRVSRSLVPLKPPYGRVTAIDLNAGNHRWMSAVGDGPRSHPALAGLDLPRLGWERRSFTLLTPTLLFVAQEGATAFRASSPERNADTHHLTNSAPALYAYDFQNGALLGFAALPGNATGSPMTYVVDGKQFIVVPIGGSGLPAELVGLALP